VSISFNSILYSIVDVKFLWQDVPWGADVDQLGRTVAAHKNGQGGRAAPFPTSSCECAPNCVCGTFQCTSLLVPVRTLAQRSSVGAMPCARSLPLTVDARKGVP
jgi:hypothetical protein